MCKSIVVSLLIAMSGCAAPGNGPDPFNEEVDGPFRALPAGELSADVRALLSSYSQALSSNSTSRSDPGPDIMGALADERRAYYAEFYDLGLHATLSSISSEFQVETASVARSGNTYRIEALEKVLLSGSARLSRAEDYPMILAARWAASRSNDEGVRGMLDEYIASTLEAVNSSLRDGAQTEFRVKHKLEILQADDQTRLLSDVFSEKETEDEDDLDAMSWIDGRFARTKPDLTRMPDYVIYHTPIEILGQQLLEDYTKASSAPVPHATGFTYNHGNAANYAVTYSSATTSLCPGNTSIFMDTSRYNQTSIYKSIWSVTTSTCNDCADFVSQALRAGGFPVDSSWSYSGSSGGYPGTYAWKVFDFSSTPGLGYYLNTSLNAISVYSSYTNLQVGDLMYSGGLHVVMVTRLSPFGYTGHTNDRLNRSYDSSLNNFWHVLTSVP